MLPLRQNWSTERRLNRHASTVLVGGLFLTLCGVLFLTLCAMPCEDDRTYGLHGDDALAMSRSKAFWKQHALAPAREMKTRLLMLVMSAVHNQHQRNTIRQTWLSDAPTQLALVKFVLGTRNVSQEAKMAVQREQFLHNDLLLFPTFQESYSNLTAKLMYALQWADLTVDYKYLLKADDDSYVRVGPLLKELQNKPAERLYWGFFNGRARVKKSGKWAEKDWFLCDRYLPYALGGGYVLSQDLVHYVSTNSEYLQQYLSEDVSLGAWLAPLKIDRVHDERFDTEFVSRGCQNDYLISHKQTAMKMQQLHHNLHKLKRLCEKPVVKRQSYTYNWNVLPSECCQRDDRILQ